MNTSPGPGVAGPVPPQRLDRRRIDRPLPDRPRRRVVPAHEVHVLAHAAGRPTPSRPTPRSCSRPGPGTASTSPARWRCCSGSTTSRRASQSGSPPARGGRRHLRRDAQRRPRLGRGVLPRRRLGAVRPDPRAGAARRRGRADERAERGGRRPERPRRLARRRRPPRPVRAATTGTPRRGNGRRVTTAPSGGSGWMRRGRRRWRSSSSAGLSGRALLRRRGLHRGSPEARLGASAGARLRRPEGPRHRGAAVPDARRDRAVPPERLSVDAGDLPARIQAVLYGGRPATAEDLADLADAPPPPAPQAARARGPRPRPCSRSTASGRRRPSGAPGSRPAARRSDAVAAAGGPQVAA